MDCLGRYQFPVFLFRLQEVSVATGIRFGFVVASVIVGAWTLSGCGESPNAVKPDKVPVAGKDDGSAKDAEAHDHDHAGHKHDGWWCPEHGVPEDQCGLCDAKLAAEFKRKGDWCKEHDRPDSQCFECHPELEGKFAALYEAKFGAKPPARSETEVP